MVATHLGVIDEDKINNMSYIFFEDILMELGHKLTYDAIVNYAGNGFCEKSWDMITKHNPFNVEDEEKNGTMRSLADFIGKSHVMIGKPEIRSKGNG